MANETANKLYSEAEAKRWRAWFADFLPSMSEDEARSTAAAIGEYVYDTSRVYNDVRDDRKIRVTSSGANVTNTAAGVQVKLPGESYFDHFNFLGSVDVESRVRGRQANIRLGGGADCMFDHLVSACWATEVAAGRGIEGQTMTSLTGCTFRVWSTIQGAWDIAKDVSSHQTIFICGGGGIGQLAITTDNGATAYRVMFVGSNMYESWIPGTSTVHAVTITGGARPLIFKNLGFAGHNESERPFTKTAGTQNLFFDTCRLGSSADRGPIITLTTSGTIEAWDCLFPSNQSGVYALDLNGCGYNTILRNCVFDNTVRVGKETHFFDCTHNHGQGARGIVALVHTGATTLHVEGSDFRSSASDFTYYIEIDRDNITFDIRGCTANVGATAAVQIGSLFNSAGAHQGVSGNAWLCDLGLNHVASSVAMIVGYTGNRHGGTTGVGAPTATPVIANGKFTNSTFDANGPARALVTFVAGSGINRVNGIQVSTGAPSHTAIEGTEYWDSTANIMYVNTNGATTWAVLSPTFSGSGGLPHKIIDADGDTYVSTEESADSDVIESASAGTIRSRLSALGLQLANGTDLEMYSGAFSGLVASIDGATGHAGFGAAFGANNVITATRTFTDPAATVLGLNATITNAMTASNAIETRGLGFTLGATGAFTASGIFSGVRALISAISASTVISDARGLESLATIVNAAGLIVNRYAAYLRTATGSGGVTNEYGLYIESMAKGATLNRAIYSAGGVSVHAGALAIGSTTAPVASALTEWTSTTQGLLIPRMTTTQQNAIGSPATGLLVYNTSLNVFKWYNGAAWITPYSIARLAFTPNAAVGAAVGDASSTNPQGFIIHSGPDGETAIKFHIDAEAVGTSLTGLVAYGDTNSLDTVATWTTIATLSITTSKSNSTTSMTNAAIPADRLIAFFVTAVSGTYTDLTASLQTKVPTQ